MDLGVKHDLIVKSGAWYSYKDEKIGQGKEKAVQFLIDRPDLAELIENQIRSLYDL